MGYSTSDAERIARLEAAPELLERLSSRARPKAQHSSRTARMTVLQKQELRPDRQ